MDIRSFLSSSGPSTSAPPSGTNSSSGSEEEAELPPTKKPHLSTSKSSKNNRSIVLQVVVAESTRKSGKKSLHGLNMTQIVEVLSVSYAKPMASLLNVQLECGQQSHLLVGKKVLKR